MENPTPKPLRRISSRHYKGLGDVVEIIVSPFAKASDKILHTDFKNCIGCQNRIKSWNRIFPFGSKDEGE